MTSEDKLRVSYNLEQQIKDIRSDPISFEDRKKQYYNNITNIYKGNENIAPVGFKWQIDGRKCFLIRE